MFENEVLKDMIANNTISLFYMLNDTDKVGDTHKCFEEYLKSKGKLEEFNSLPEDKQQLIKYVGIICLFDSNYDECVKFVGDLL